MNFDGSKAPSPSDRTGEIYHAIAELDEVVSGDNVRDEPQSNEDLLKEVDIPEDVMALALMENTTDNQFVGACKKMGRDKSQLDFACKKW